MSLQNRVTSLQGMAQANECKLDISTRDIDNIFPTTAVSN